MKKLLLAFACFVGMGQGLMGMDDDFSDQENIDSQSIQRESEFQREEQRKNKLKHDEMLNAFNEGYRVGWGKMGVEKGYEDAENNSSSYPRRFLKLTGKHIENRAAQAIAELVVDVPLSFGLQYLKMWWYADTIRKNQLHEQVVQKEKALKKSTKNTADAFTQHNRRAIEQYNELKPFVSHIDHNAFEKSVAQIQQKIEEFQKKEIEDFNKVIESKKEYFAIHQEALKQEIEQFKKALQEEVEEHYKKDLESLYKQCNMTEQDLDLVMVYKQIRHDLPVNVKKEMMYNAALIGINEQQLQQAQEEYMVAFQMLKKEEERVRK